MALILFFVLYSAWHQGCLVECLACQSCLGARSPRDCKTATCGPGEVCFVEEALTVTFPQEVRFNLGCESQQVCQSLATSSRGRRHLKSRDKNQVPAVTACYRCCDSDLCNRGNCSVLDWCGSSPCSNGSTCENTDTGFLCHCPFGFTGNTCSQDVNECLTEPCHNGGTCVNYAGSFACACPLRYEGPHCELRSKGTVCQFCQGVTSPLLCNNPVVCKGNEECYTDQVQTEGRVTYNMGCRSEAFCSFYKQYAQMGRRQAHAVTTCTDCCRQDDCNRDVCRQEPAGLICISCDRVGSKEDCHNVTVCDATQECYNREEVDLRTGRKTFTAGCLDTQVCASVTNMAVGKRDATTSHDVITSRDVSTSLGTCVECCGRHYCNKELCVGATPASSTTTPASTSPAVSAVCDTLPFNPCHNGGTCVNSPDGTFHCLCPLGFSSPSCSTVSAVCDTLPFNPCHNGGTCVNSPDGAFHCLCPLGFSGPSCSTGPSTSAQTTVPTTPTSTPGPCLSLVCQHGGSCVVTSGTAKCVCMGDFTGDHCEVDPCKDSPCQNSAPCVVSSEGRAQCQCPGGFSGPHCQHSVCDSRPCLNGGSCHVDKGAVTCSCAGKFTGQHCETRLCHFVDINSIGCGSVQDVAILLSGGERTNTPVARHMVHFVETLLQHPGTRVDAAHTHVAVAYFDSAPHTVIPLSGNPRQVASAMTSSPFYHYHGSNAGVSLTSALEHARTRMLSQGRPDTDKVILAILAQVETDAGSLRAAAARLKEDCVSLNVIALGQLLTPTDDDEASLSQPHTFGQLLTLPDDDDVSLSQPHTLGQLDTMGQLVSQPDNDDVSLSQPDTLGQLVSQPDNDDVSLSQPDTLGQLVSQPDNDDVSLSQPDTLGQLVSQPDNDDASLSQPDTLGQLVSQHDNDDASLSQPDTLGQRGTLGQLLTPIDADDASLSQPTTFGRRDSLSLPATQGLTHAEFTAVAAMLGMYDLPAQHRKYVSTSAALDSAAWNQYFESGALCGSSHA